LDRRREELTLLRVAPGFLDELGEPLLGRFHLLRRPPVGESRDGSLELVVQRDVFLDALLEKLDRLVLAPRLRARARRACRKKPREERGQQEAPAGHAVRI